MVLTNYALPGQVPSPYSPPYAYAQPLGTTPSFNQLGLASQPWDVPQQTYPVYSQVPAPVLPAPSATERPAINGFYFDFVDYGISAESLQSALSGMSGPTADLFNKTQSDKVTIAQLYPTLPGTGTTQLSADQLEAKRLFKEAQMLQLELLGVKMPTQTTAPEPVNPIVKEPAPISPTPTTDPSNFVPVTPESVKPQPVVSDPIKPQPVVNEPVAPQPVVNEPVTPQPVVNEPVAPQPVAQPVQQPPAQPVIDFAADQPGTSTIKGSGAKGSNKANGSNKAKGSNNHPHGGPPGQLRKQGIEVVKGINKGSNRVKGSNKNQLQNVMPDQVYDKVHSRLHSGGGKH